MNHAELGPLLRGMRLSAGLTLEQLAQTAGVSDRAIGDMKRGVSRAPRVSTILALANALHLNDEEREALAAAARAGRRQSMVPATLHDLPLPRAVADFTGRADELRSIRHHADQLRAGTRKPVLLISGAPGMGKTSLAVHAATRLSDLFPDGRYFVELQGLASQPVTPVGVLAQLIQAVSTRVPTIPTGLAEATDLWHRVSSGKRILMVLDNAADEAQIRAAMPTDTLAMIVATSRRMLRGLPEIDRLQLAPLSERDSVALLSGMMADRSVAAEELQRLAHLCANVPLAMRVAGNRLSSRRFWTARI